MHPIAHRFWLSFALVAAASLIGGLQFLESGSSWAEYALVTPWVVFATVTALDVLRLPAGARLAGLRLLLTGQTPSASRPSPTRTATQAAELQEREMTWEVLPPEGARPERYR